MPFTVTEQSTVLPVTVDLLKKHSNVTFDIDDDLIEFYMIAVVSYGEKITGRKFVQSTFELDLESFPLGVIDLLPNLQSVASIVYTDSEGVEQTLDDSLYKVKKTTLVGYVDSVDYWPTGAKDIIITFDAGWPVAVGDISTTPSDLKLWIMAKVADYYTFRETFVVSSGSRADVAEMPKTFVDNMLSNFIVPGIGSGI